MFFVWYNVYTRASLGAQWWRIKLPMQETQVRSLGQEDTLEKGNGNTLQYSCLRNPMDRGSWQATVHEVTKEVDVTWQLINNNCLYCQSY